MMRASPWDISSVDKRFHRAVGISIACGLVAMLLVANVTLPVVVENETPDPVRIAEILLPPPKRIEPPKIELPKPEPELPEVKVEPIKKSPEIVAEAVVAEAPQTVKQAKEKARVSGLLAFKDELQSMRDQLNETRLQDTATLTRGAGESVNIQRSVLTSKASAKRATINTAELSQITGGIALAARESTVVEAVVDETATTGAMRLVRLDVSGVRSIEEIRRVFDANKGAIFSIYNRQLRKDPGLLGKVVLELVIEPDGTVSACEVLTSELESDELITRVVRRVQLFDFGERDVSVTRISYPVHFLPT